MRLGVLSSRSDSATMSTTTTGAESPARASKSERDDDTHLRIVWVDLEMTGLNIEKDTIIEIACIITDHNLNVIAQETSVKQLDLDFGGFKGPDLIIHQSDEVMNNMGDWCKKHHGESGLTAAVKKSNITMKDAEQRVLEFVKQHVPSRSCPLAGNSVHADKKFLDKYMPSFSEYLHYRIIDVSSVKELAKRWYPENCDLSWKKCRHRSLDDIVESIEELKQYRASIFKQP